LKGTRVQALQIPEYFKAASITSLIVARGPRRFIYVLVQLVYLKVQPVAQETKYQIRGGRAVIMVLAELHYEREDISRILFFSFRISHPFVPLQTNVLFASGGTDRWW
jgi:hypothetical protein